MPTQKPVRFGVVGSGSIVDTMLAGAAAYPALQLTAVYSRSAERAAAYAAQHGAPHTFTSLPEMAQSDVLDMVYIASPNRLHMEQAAVFLQNGKHVLCEKPLTAFPEELDAQLLTAKQQGCLLTEAIMLLFQPQLEILRAAVRQIGAVSTVHLDFSQLSSRYPAYLRGETPNIFTPALETGALQDLGVYCVYLALALFGAPADIRASASFLRTGADGACAALLIYPEKTVTLTCSKIGQAAAPSTIVGDKGTITIGSVSKLENISLQRFGDPPQVLWGEEEKPVLMGREIDTFAGWLREKTPPPAYLRHQELSRMAAACLYRIRRSAGITFPRDTAASRS